jgi:UDP-2,3-diacylglucosamine hydrolase
MEDDDLQTMAPMTTKPTPPNGSVIYLLSDFHLGSPSVRESRDREQLLLQFFEETMPSASAYYLLGDVFDFWFELRHAIPKHFVRLQGCLARVSDRGIPVHYFTGNHDLWTFGYLESELGVILHRDALEVEWEGRRLLLAHGDGKGPGDYGFKRLRRIFHSPWCQRLFALLHPNLSFALAQHWSRNSRLAQTPAEAAEFEGTKSFDPHREWLYRYCLRQQNQRKQAGLPFFDYLVFGHRHLPVFCPLPEGGIYVNLGDWIRHFTYGRFEKGQLDLLAYPGNFPSGLGRHPQPIRAHNPL